MRELGQLIWIFVPLSLLSFGGGSSILAPLHTATVDQHHWMTTREFIDYFAISRAAPGPGAMIVTLIGWKVAGWTGALVATLGMFVPSSLLCFGLAKVWNRYRGTPLHTALEQGLLPVGTGLSIAGGLLIMQAAGTGAVTWVIAILATALFIWRNVYPLIALAMGGVVAVLWYWTIGSGGAI